MNNQVTNKTGKEEKKSPPYKCKFGKTFIKLTNKKIFISFIWFIGISLKEMIFCHFFLNFLVFFLFHSLTSIIHIKENYDYWKWFCVWKIFYDLFIWFKSKTSTLESIFSWFTTADIFVLGNFILFKFQLSYFCGFRSGLSIKELKM